ncbi:hypothetical protein PR001_g13975 [Phytophthora rubi]|uniref:Uncharacterized protein n=1 Tax=Phytophthora rubi TaxID=129364 RepID=A0A6A3LTB9_9STRA|nr:hypothetical protein PR001_g13975 [Phytophthora rubi]
MNKQILAFVQAKEDGAISPELIDVFCEKGVFEHEDTRRILEASKKAGLEINFHGDEIHPMHRLVTVLARSLMAGAGIDPPCLLQVVYEDAARTTLSLDGCYTAGSDAEAAMAVFARGGLP